MKVEFFHDVICSFCFPMSYRMKKVVQKYPKLDIIHRSFALGWEVDQFIQMFGSHEAVKPEVLNHWKTANENDDLSRFNIEGMKNKDFFFPTSKPGLVAAKAAGMVQEQESYWEVFDAIQNALFVENRDIADTKVLENIVKQTSVNFEDWKKQFENPKTEQAVLEDLALVQNYGIQGAPALVVEGKYLISGAQPQDAIEETLEDIAEKENLQLKGLQMMGTDSSACRIVDGNGQCD